ncbi:FAD-binding protein [Sinorhizobium fredii]|uniref:FAD-binding protein n=1 Tax=Rhizobium fredii TaxID=380 RepID=UPI003516D547
MIDANVRVLAEPVTNLIVSPAGKYDTIIAATSSGKNVMPRVAALLDVAQVSDIIEVISPDTFKRPIYAGNAIWTMRATDTKKLITARTASFSPASRGQLAAVEDISTAALSSKLSNYVPNALSFCERPELTSAKIIISGGRVLGSAEKFREVILPVASKLGAAIGASRAAVDAGYTPNDWQVRSDGQRRRSGPICRSRHPGPSSTSPA